LTADGFVISSDEKTFIQARCRCHPSLPPGTARMMRVNHDYHRRGAVAYLATYGVHRAKVFGRCHDTCAPLLRGIILMALSIRAVTNVISRIAAPTDWKPPPSDPGSSDNPTVIASRAKGSDRPHRAHPFAAFAGRFQVAEVPPSTHRSMPFT